MEPDYTATHELTISSIIVYVRERNARGIQGGGVRWIFKGKGEVLVIRQIVYMFGKFINIVQQPKKKLCILLLI